MTTLYLARHGETIDNANKIMQGQTQGRLTDNGRKQAAELADRLAAVHLDAIISSDLRRAIDTASTVAATRGLAVTTTPLLRERDWGSFTGRYIPGKTVLAVGHGIINKAIQAVHFGKQMNEIARMENAEVRVLHID